MSHEDDSLATEIERHSRVVHTAASHMDLGEHVSYLLGQACDGVDYPMEVTVTIEAEEVDDE